MLLLRVTADRRGNTLVTRRREVIGQIPDDPDSHYWAPIIDIILDCMERDGVLTNTTLTNTKGGGLATT